jgi:hypothetical protein
MARWSKIEDSIPIYKIVRTEQDRQILLTPPASSSASAFNRQMSASAAPPGQQTSAAADGNNCNGNNNNKKKNNDQQRKSTFMSKNLDSPPNAASRTFHQLFVICFKDSMMGVGMNEEKKLLVQLNDLETIEWIETKINSCIKYVKELKTKFEI